VLLNTFIILALLLTLAFALVIVLPHLYGRFSRVLLARRCRRARALVLTYDDGPGASLTPELVALLRNHAAKATFFCLGMKAEANPEIMDLLKSEGHELACHSHRHRHPWKSRPAAALRDIGEGFDALARWLSPLRWYRPPYGKITLHTWFALLARRAKIVWWTHDSGDTWKNCPASVDGLVQSVIHSGGGVVLLHDFDRGDAGDAASRTGYVLSATRSLIEQARQAGLQVMTLGELFQPSGQASRMADAR